MSLLRTDAEIEALVVTRGHPFARDAFFGALESFSDVACTAVEHPAAQHFFSPENAGPYDAFLVYDMPGIEFRPEGPVFHDPPEAYKRSFLELVEAGQGFVFLHHAIAGWPTWDAYAELLGGRFLYAPATLRGTQRPDSGYRHDVVHRVSVVDSANPVTRPVTHRLEGGFEIEDEVYLHEVFEDTVMPLLRSDYAFVEDNFYSAALAVRGKMFAREGWSHAPGSDLVGWVRRQGRSPIVYLACGDGPKAYANPGFRTLVHDAIRWVASDEARDWAAAGGG